MILELVCMLRHFHSESIVLLDCTGNLSKQTKRKVSEIEWNRSERERIYGDWCKVVKLRLTQLILTRMVIVECAVGGLIVSCLILSYLALS